MEQKTVKTTKTAKKRTEPGAQASKAALRQLKSICRDPDQRAQDRIAAAKVLLEYGGLPKEEASKLTVKVDAPRDWLK